MNSWDNRKTALRHPEDKADWTSALFVDEFEIRDVE